MTEEKERRLVFEFFPIGNEIEDEVLYEDMLFALDMEMKALQPDGGTTWYAEVTNFGWRSLDGVSGAIDVGEDRPAETLLQKILPNTPCSFRVFADDEGLYLQNFHHDSPWGREWYSIYPKEKLVPKLVSLLMALVPEANSDDLEDDIVNWLSDLPREVSLLDEEEVKMYYRDGPSPFTWV